MRYSDISLVDHLADETHALSVISNTLSQRIVDEDPEDLIRDVHQALTGFDKQLARVIEIRAKVGKMFAT